MEPPRILLVFVDGLGLPTEPLDESAYAACPAIRTLLSRHCAPLDACLGVDGTPQSATGQTALFTGLNAPAAIGHHCAGFPGPELRRLLKAGNLFSWLRDAGRRCTFANAYVVQPGNELPSMFRSVTTVMTLDALGGTLNRAELEAGAAVYHDISRHTMAARGVHGIPTISEAQAATHLLGILRRVDVCLFEYFLTDHAGHRGTLAERQEVLASLDRFLGALMAGLERRSELLILFSDHGNIEDRQARGHTRNPVPWAACGAQAEAAVDGMRSLLDVTPRILRLAAAAAVTAPSGGIG